MLGTLEIIEIVLTILLLIFFLWISLANYLDQPSWKMKYVNSNGGVVFEARNKKNKAVTLAGVQVVFRIPELSAYASAPFNEITLKPNKDVQNIITLHLSGTEPVAGKKYSAVTEFTYMDGSSKSYKQSSYVIFPSAMIDNTAQQVTDV